MRFKVKCKKYLAVEREWLLKSGEVYEAIKRKDEKIDVINHKGIAITLTLKEFKNYCEIINKI